MESVVNASAEDLPQLLEKAGEITVGSWSDPNSVAFALEGRLASQGAIKVVAVGAWSVNQAAKGVAIVRSLLQPRGLDLLVSPRFAQVESMRTGNEVTAVELVCFDRPTFLPNVDEKEIESAQEVRVSASTNTMNLAAALATMMSAQPCVKVQAVGPVSVNQAVKAIAAARNFLPSGVEIYGYPLFVRIPSPNPETDPWLRSAVQWRVFVDWKGQQPSVPPQGARLLASRRRPQQAGSESVGGGETIQPGNQRRPPPPRRAPPPWQARRPFATAGPRPLPNPPVGARGPRPLRPLGRGADRQQTNAPESSAAPQTNPNAPPAESKTEQEHKEESEEDSSNHDEQQEKVREQESTSEQRHTEAEKTSEQQQERITEEEPKERHEKMSEQQESISELQKQISEHQEKVSELQEKVTEQQKEISEHHEQNNKQHESLSEHEQVNIHEKQTSQETTKEQKETVSEQERSTEQRSEQEQSTEHAESEPKATSSADPSSSGAPAAGRPGAGRTRPARMPRAPGSRSPPRVRGPVDYESVGKGQVPYRPDEEELPISKQIRVSGATRNVNLAPFMAKLVQTDNAVQAVAIGAAAINVAVKAFAGADAFLGDGTVIAVYPSFTRRDIRDGMEVTAIKFTGIPLKPNIPEDVVEYWVATTSTPGLMGAAIEGRIREGKPCKLVAQGAGAINTAMKSIAVARVYALNDHLDVAFLPRFTQITRPTGTFTALEMVILTGVDESAKRQSSTAE